MNDRIEGFTLVELLIVVVIIGILAAIAIPNFIAYRQKSYDSAALSDIKNAYTAAQDYFTDNPVGSVSLSILKDHGYRQSSEIIVEVPSGGQTDLQITARHSSGLRTYSVNNSGTISF